MFWPAINLRLDIIFLQNFIQLLFKFSDIFFACFAPIFQCLGNFFVSPDRAYYLVDTAKINSKLFSSGEYKKGKQ
ncbi:MAG TPA: hypothetical protein EYP51_01695, partial [Thiotrichales bacterium]|nr:hypothetical protein [Thiotrichales bacterium]